MKMRRIIAMSLWTVAGTLPVMGEAGLSALVPAGVNAILKEHCAKCRGPKKQKGDLRFDTLSGDFLKDAAAAETWHDAYGMSPEMMVFVVLSTCIAAPIAEEIMCRGVLCLDLKRRLGPWPALLISSLIFGLQHWQYDAVGIAGVTLMGVVAALLVWRTGALFPASALHSLFNLALTIHSYVVCQWPVYVGWRVGGF